MHKIIITLLFLTLFLNSNLYAQMKSGYRFGVNLTSMSVKNNGTSIKSKTPLGIHFGAVYEFPLSGNSAFQSGFVLSSKGTDYEINKDEYSIAPVYIEIPLNAVYYAGRHSSKFFIFAGPYFASAFAGYKIDPSGDHRDLKFGPGEDNDLKRLDAGINLGAGISVKEYLFSVQYGLGLRNVSAGKDLDIKNKVIGISISRLIPVNKK